MASSEDLARRIELQFDSWGAVAGSPASPALERSPTPGQWSAREHLAHIARMHEIYKARIAKILAEDGARLPPYRAEEDPEWESWRALPAEELLERSRKMRIELVEKVRSLSEPDLARIGVHTRLGPLALSLWLHFFLLHEAHHLYQIFKLVREE
ncbi:MAG TPA: DinB family protein [Anaeromyxobacteraceae bacterium]|nr:DinB family protein [Anaeromyxobacteraceae bacterium]